MTLENTLDVPLRDDVSQLFARAPAPEPSDAVTERAAAISRELGEAWAEGTLPPGAQVGPYLVEGLIGSGGQGTVYRARGEDGRDYALKVPRPELVSRLVREAQILFHLDHPRVVRIEKAVVDAEVPYIVTEFHAAGSLADRLRAGDGALDEGLVVRLATETLEALAYAHEKGVVHRDLKPANILFDDAGTVKVADFGIGRLELVESLGMEGTLVSSDGTVFAGTPLYMAPEQELPGEPVDGRADLYALGKVLYQVLTGRSPRTVQPLSKVAPALAVWDPYLFRLLEDDPDRRFQSAEEALEALRHLGSAPPPVSSGVTPFPAGPELPAPLEVHAFEQHRGGQVVRPSAGTIRELSRALTWFGLSERGVRMVFLGDRAPVGFALPISAGALISLLAPSSPWRDAVILICGDYVVGALRSEFGSAGPPLHLMTRALSLELVDSTGACRLQHKGSPTLSLRPDDLLANMRSRGLVATEPSLRRVPSAPPAPPRRGLGAGLAGLALGVALGLALGSGLGLLKTVSVVVLAACGVAAVAAVARFLAQGKS